MGRQKQRETVISSQSQGRGKAAASRGRAEDAGEKPGAGQCGSLGWELLGHWPRGTRPPGPSSGGAWETGAFACYRALWSRSRDRPDPEMGALGRARAQENTSSPAGCGWGLPAVT